MQMDVVRPLKGEAPFPAVVCIHGGGFRAGTRQSFLPIAYYLAQHGYVAATVSYRLSPMNQFPAPVEDVKAAVRFLRANAARFQIDPDRIGAVGGSAGGHLALMLGVTGGVAEFEGAGPNLERSSSVQAVVNLYGPTDLTKSYEPGKSVDAAEVLPMFLGGDLEHNRPAHVRASPLYWVSPDTAPTLTVHGTKDNYVAYEHAVWLTERLEAAGVPAKLETIEGAGHGFHGADLERANGRWWRGSTSISRRAASSGCYWSPITARAAKSWRSIGPPAASAGRCPITAATTCSFCPTGMSSIRPAIGGALSKSTRWKPTRLAAAPLASAGAGARFGVTGRPKACGIPSPPNGCRTATR